jgi:hypothetical protein
MLACMNQTPPTLGPVNRDAVLRLFMERLWLVLFDEGVSGLISPLQIFNERLDHKAIRAQEFSYIELAEKDLRDVVAGRKTITESGHINDSVAPEAIRINPIIDNSQAELDAVERRLGANALLKHVAREVRVKELMRSLHVRKIALHAERYALDVVQGHPAEKITERMADADWLSRWREYAQDTYSETMQCLLAKVIVEEVWRPGTTSIYTLDFLRHLSGTDVQTIEIASQFSFGDFIFREARGYFVPEIHKPVFELLESYNLLTGVSRGDKWTTLTVADPKQPLLLRCHSRALLVTPADPQGLHLPVYMLTKLGKEVMRFIHRDADVAYLWAIATELKSLGCTVQLGECVDEPGQPPRFRQKVVV